ncbi:hypothetical protein EXIGLDRAFT_356952 [Exidia glandulosa HHB12029]|uniref:Protein CPL1-like domain-containing protein n=1 Tax=Exidia glandulosa HHB12029 TaxID=1314781 RepID=A0A165C922_EXIGL|nr:hypothetical protein EXIGLDRAFT_356952 [Exidia glandulosa HHB12029]
MVGTHALSSFALVASFATAALATTCPSNKFLWDAKHICLPKGGPSTIVDPPSLTGCPDQWYWAGSYCAPKNAQCANSVSCGNNYVWDVSCFACKPPKCASNKFWYDFLGQCIVKGGPTNPPSPPVGSSCPSGWYWKDGKSICVPKQPNFSSPPSCGTDIWSPSDQCCHAPPKPTCGKNEFYWGTRNCCLPHGGPTTPPPSPPAGNTCPSNWSWHHGKGCCVPHFPNPPSNPTCPGRNWHWNPTPCSCQPSTPQPSSGVHATKKKRVLDTTLCPRGLTACPIDGLFGGEYECLDTTRELESCGGCASKGLGHDCTSISHAWNVGCDRGACVVYSCDRGYGVSTNGTSCESL